MDYLLAAMIGGVVVGLSLIWGWMVAGRPQTALVPAPTAMTAPQLAYSAPPRQPVVVRTKAPSPASAASLATRRLEEVVAAHRARRDQ